jgi:putative hemolysin
VQEGALDTIIGVISVKDALEVLTEQASTIQGNGTLLRALVQKAPVVLDNTSALDVVSAIRTSRLHMTLVFDEYGHFEGIVTSGDVLEAIAGEFLESDDPEPAIVTREDGSLLVSGWMPIDEFSDQIGLKLARNAHFSTVAGYILAELSHLPRVGEVFERGPWRFEIVDMDGRRIDKILLSKAISSQTAAFDG